MVNLLYWGYINKRRKGTDMKSTKQTEAPKSKKNINWAGLYSLAVALAELGSTYVFATQDNKVLWGLAVVLGVDCTQRLARAFMR